MSVESKKTASVTSPQHDHIAQVYEHISEISKLYLKPVTLPTALPPASVPASASLPAAPAAPVAHASSSSSSHAHASRSVVAAAPAPLCPHCKDSPSSPFNAVLASKFPGSLPLEDFVFQTKQLLVPRGFYPQVNALVCVGLCRDEITSPFEEEVESLWGQAFICGSLGGMLFCGRTGFSAAHHHAPKNGRFIYFCFTHIAVDHEGNVGSVYRTRSGMSEKTTACGALAAFTAEIASGNVNLKIDEDDIEQSMLKREISRKTSLPLDGVNPPDLLGVTLAAFDVITQDLEKHVLHDASLYHERQYALFTGIQVHGPDGSDYAWLGKSSLVKGGVLSNLPFTLHRAKGAHHDEAAQSSHHH